ncbi:MAG: glycosyltransferase family A protein [Mucilaginibacter sp.]
MANPLVTIIIPTYKDWNRLGLCIAALEKQTYPAGLIQVIIVNNAPADQPPAGYYLPANISIIDEGQPGSYAARNAGLKLAKGDILGFTDSDCIPVENWIESAVNLFTANPDVDRIAGNVILFFEGDKPQPSELYESIYAFQQEANAKNGVSVTANMFTRKHVFDSAGVFDDAKLSGGDIEWSARAKAKGFLIRYSAETAVKHPARKGLHLMAKKSRRVASGKGKMNNNGYLKESVRLLFKLRPKLKEWKVIKAKGKHLSLGDKVVVYWVKWYLDSVRVVERFRLLNGGKPYNDI